jgi:hypothetical protein
MLIGQVSEPAWGWREVNAGMTRLTAVNLAIAASECIGASQDHGLYPLRTISAVLNADYSIYLYVAPQ